MLQSKIIIGGGLVMIGLLSSIIQANAWDSLPYHPLEKFEQQQPMTAEQETQVRQYMRYELREPCQNYKPAPDGFYRDRCDLNKIETLATEPEAPKSKIYMKNDVLIAYKVNFAFDSATIDTVADSTLERVAAEIAKYNPSEVIVSGYTDRAGSPAYNDTLSQSRALSVSNALNKLGVANRVINREAYGERNSAVETNDGVALLENRRVIIEFLK